VSPASGEIGIGDLGYANERHNKIIDSREHRTIQANDLALQREDLSARRNGASIVSKS
jgi:hypothetical protein